MRRTTLEADRGLWTVGPAADAVGTTVRALHHYDAIGLVVPSGRTPAGYRVYTDADLDRVRHVLVYRELGFALEDVAALLDGDDDDRARRIREQVDAVSERIGRLQQVQAALEQEMEAQMNGVRLTQAEKRELFGDTWVENEQDYAREAEQSWGDTDAWRQSQRRAASYGKADWQTIKAEADGINRRFVALMQAGEPADGEAATAVAEEHRRHIDRWFYSCSPEMHAGLGRMYVQDERFAATYEGIAAGLARYVSEAVQANAAARG
jgi:MerR family transcriptional regulator, thiopeptide resistance regulator